MLVPLGDTYEFLFTTRNFSTGAPYTLAGTPVLSVYEEANLTQITAGVSLSADYDSVTGLNQCSIVASSGNGFEVGKYYSVVITTGTVNSVSVVGEVIGHFRVGPAENQAGHAPVDAIYIEGSDATDQINAACDVALTDYDAVIPSDLGTFTDLGAGATLANNLADMAGGTFSSATDSLEAIRDRGDAAWVTGGGGSLTQNINMVPLIPGQIDIATTTTYRLGLSLYNSLDDLPSTAEITPGTISIERKANGGTSWTAVVTDAACSESAGVIYYDEEFNDTDYDAGDQLRITFKSISVTADTNTYEIIPAGGIMFYTYVVEVVTVPSAAEIRAEIDTNSTQLAAIVADTNELQTDNVPGLIAALNNISASDVTTDMDANSTQLAAIVADTNELQTDWVNGGRLDLLLDAVKAKTDSLTFTVAGVLDANVRRVNSVPIVGDGSTTPFTV